MPRGYKDFFASPIFPQYGVTDEEPGSALILPSTTIEVVAIEGKGIVLNLVITAEPLSAHPDDIIRFYVDGEQISFISWIGALAWGHVVPLVGEHCLVCYDPENLRYQMDLAGPFNFSVSVSITYQNVGSDNVQVYGYITHTKVVA